MIIEKGHYQYVKVGLGNASITNKSQDIPIYSDDCKTVVGTAKIIEENPLMLDLTITRDMDIGLSYFVISPMNYTLQNGYIIKIMSFKITADDSEWKPIPVSVDELVGKQEIVTVKAPKKKKEK